MDSRVVVDVQDEGDGVVSVDYADGGVEVVSVAQARTLTMTPEASETLRRIETG